MQPALVLAVVLAQAALAQTPAQMEYERQQREYWRQQEQQRQEQQRQQQLMNENARRQQEESRRAMQGQNAGQGVGMGASMGSRPALGGGGAVPGGAAGAQLEQARQTWLKRPPLATAQNPLLGAWTRPQAKLDPNNPFAQAGALLKGGLCEVFFSGNAVFEFKPAALVGIDKRTRQAQTLDQVEYRGDAKHVAVIPRSTLKLIVFDFDGPDRIRWSGQNCTLTRVGGQGTAKAR